MGVRFTLKLQMRLLKHMNKFYTWLMNTKFFKWGFNQNWAIWFHMGAGAVGAKIAMNYFSNWNSLLVISLLAVLWELVEFECDGGINGMIKIYGSLERWFYDSLGDIIGAMLMAYVVVL